MERSRQLNSLQNYCRNQLSLSTILTQNKCLSDFDRRGFQSCLDEGNLVPRWFSYACFSWGPDFRSDVESSVAPVWISLPNLPLFPIGKNCLQSIRHLIGKPLSIENVIADLSRPSVAHICVEIDLLKKLPHRLWLECGDSIPWFWQDIIYEKLPHYCRHCRRLGHDVTICKQANPPLPNSSDRINKGKAPIASIY